MRGCRILFEQAASAGNTVSPMSLWETTSCRGGHPSAAAPASWGLNPSESDGRAVVITAGTVVCCEHRTEDLPTDVFEGSEGTVVRCRLITTRGGSIVCYHSRQPVSRQGVDCAETSQCYPGTLRRVCIFATGSTTPTFRTGIPGTGFVTTCGFPVPVQAAL